MLTYFLQKENTDIKAEDVQLKSEKNLPNEFEKLCLSTRDEFKKSTSFNEAEIMDQLGEILEELPLLMKYKVCTYVRTYNMYVYLAFKMYFYFECSFLP